MRICFLIYIPIVLGIIVTDPPPTGDEYKYSYSIDDPTTGDSKSQHEAKYGDTVTGAYSVVDPDGTKRTVEYRADPRTGFNAVVKLEPSATKAPHYLKSQYIVRKPMIDRFTTIPQADGIFNRLEVYFSPENQLQPLNSVGREQYFVPVNKYYNF